MALLRPVDHYQKLQQSTSIVKIPCFQDIFALLEVSYKQA